MNGRFDLHGRVAVVTGAAQGLGLAIADALAEEGAAVALLDVRGIAVSEAAHLIAAERGTATIGLMCDTRDRTQVDSCVEQVLSTYGKIDILVNNAGIHRRGTPTAYDRVLSTRYGLAAIDAVHDEAWGDMVVLRSSRITRAPMTEAMGKNRTVDLDLYHDVAHAFFG